MVRVSQVEAEAKINCFANRKRAVQTTANSSTAVENSVLRPPSRRLFRPNPVTLSARSHLKPQQILAWYPDAPGRSWAERCLAICRWCLSWRSCLLSVLDYHALFTPLRFRPGFIRHCQCMLAVECVAANEFFPRFLTSSAKNFQWGRMSSRISSSCGTHLSKLPMA